MKNIIFSFFLVSQLISCNDSNTDSKIIGKWILDSATTIDGNYHHTQYKKTITFKDNNEFILSMNTSCTYLKYRGNFYIHKKSSSEIRTLVLIPEQKNYYKTNRGIENRLPYMIFDIVSLTENRLEGITETKRKYDNDTLVKELNETLIFKKLLN